MERINLHRCSRRGAFELPGVCTRDGYVWGSNACTAAARGGHLACLQYAHEHGAEWDLPTSRAAAAAKQFDCLRYALDHGCVCDAVCLDMFASTSTDATADAEPSFVSDFAASAVTVFPDVISVTTVALDGATTSAAHHQHLRRARP